MPTLYEVRDRLNRPVFNVIAPKINGAIAVEGLPGAVVTQSEFNREKLKARPRVDFPGQRVTVHINGNPFSQQTHFHSQSTVEFLSEIDVVKVVFEDLRKVKLEAKHLALAAAHLAIAMLVLIGGTYFLSLGVHFYVGAVKALLLAVSYGVVAVASAAAVLYVLNLIWGVTMLGFVLDTLIALAVGWVYIEIVSRLLPMVVSIDTHLGALACSVGLVLLFAGACMLTGVLKPHLIPKYLLPRTWRSAT